jgi:hypothetical protein
MWDVPSWRGNERLAQLNGDDSTDAREVSQQSSSDIKPNGSDAAIDSNGDHNEPMIMSTPVASSPVPMPTSAAPIAAEG